ncbi:MAG: hypothetical protein AAF799_14000 [Myxococcota bacterium]
MRLDNPAFLNSLLLSCGLLTLGACGDDGGTGSGGGDATTTGDASTGAETPVATTADSVDTTAGPEETTTTDDPTTGVDTTAGEEDESSGDTGPMGDCFGGGMSFDMLTSTDNDMVTNLDVDNLLVSCNLDITLTATGGTVCVADDGAGGYYYTVETIEMEDLPPIQCGALAMVGLSEVAIQNTGNNMEVVVPTDGGMMTGNQLISIQGNVSGSALMMPLDVPLEMFNGSLPEGDVAFGADDTSMTYADDSHIVAVAMPEFAGQTIVITLTGLDGALTFAM